MISLYKKSKKSFDYVIKYYSKAYSGISINLFSNIILSCMVSTLTGTFYFLSYYFHHILNYNMKIVGIFISSYGVGTLVGGITAGKLSDRFSPTIILKLSFLLLSSGYFLLLIKKSAFLLMINIFLLGVGSYSFIIANQLIILNQCAAYGVMKLKAINYLNLASNLGLCFSALLANFFAKRLFNDLFILNGVIFSLLMLFYLKKRVVQQKITASLNPDKGKISILQNKSFLQILVCLLLIGCIVAQMSTTYSVFIQKTFPHYGLSGFSLLFIINTLIVVFFQMPLGEILANKNKKLLAGFGAILVSISMALLSQATYFNIVILASVIYSFGEIIFFSMAQLICYESAPEHKKGTYMGLYRLIYSISRIIGPIMGGALFYYANTLVWIVASAAALLSAFVLFLFKVI